MKSRLDYNSVPWNELVYYDETSPSCLRWKDTAAKISKNRAKDVGKAVGVKMYRGYYKVGFNNHEYYCHRVVWILHNTKIDNSLSVDHINGDVSDNTIGNLREVSHKSNLQNVKLRANNSSGITGVSYSRQKLTGAEYWQAYINDASGKRVIKSFSIIQLGYDRAFELACEYRNNLVIEQNNAGAEYTERHGT